MQLTKETDKIFCLIYQEYLNRRKTDVSKISAILFQYPEALQSEFLQGIHTDDIYSALHELHRNGLIKEYTDGGFILLDAGIIYMENRFKNGLKEVLEYISLFK